METEICTINIGNGMLDNEFTFYESGRIRHFYDQNIYKPNQTRWITANELSGNEKEKILQKCPEEFKDRIVSILT